jgi:hypothetical protein
VPGTKTLTTSTSGNYSDEWSSESEFFNNEWKLVSGAMTGSGGTYFSDSTRIDVDYEIDYDYINASFQYLVMHSYACENYHYSSSHVIDESFSVRQTVSNGEWVIDDHTTTVTETLHSSDTRAYVRSGYTFYLCFYSGSSSSSTELSSTRVFNQSGLVSSSWSSEWKESSVSASDEYDSAVVCKYSSNRIFVFLGILSI